jgi:hypothetical protein
MSESKSKPKELIIGSTPSDEHLIKHREDNPDKLVLTFDMEGSSDPNHLQGDFNDREQLRDLLNLLGQESVNRVIFDSSTVKFWNSEVWSPFEPHSPGFDFLSRLVKPDGQVLFETPYSNTGACLAVGHILNSNAGGLSLNQDLVERLSRGEGYPVNYRLLPHRAFGQLPPVCSSYRLTGRMVDVGSLLRENRLAYQQSHYYAAHEGPTQQVGCQTVARTLEERFPFSVRIKRDGYPLKETKDPVFSYFVLTRNHTPVQNG